MNARVKGLGNTILQCIGRLYSGKNKKITFYNAYRLNIALHNY